MLNKKLIQFTEPYINGNEETCIILIYIKDVFKRNSYYGNEYYAKEYH